MKCEFVDLFANIHANWLNQLFIGTRNFIVNKFGAHSLNEKKCSEIGNVMQIEWLSAQRMLNIEFLRVVM